MAEWQLLCCASQNMAGVTGKVALILRDCGYETEVEKEIDLWRRKAAIDGYAQRPGSLPSMVLCECKYLKKNVPRSAAREITDLISRKEKSATMRLREAYHLIA
jgi:hypothetical protein